MSGSGIATYILWGRNCKREVQTGFREQGQLFGSKITDDPNTQPITEIQ